MSRLPVYERDEALVHAGNDAQRADRYLSLLLGSFEEFRETTVAARQAGDWQRIRQATHRMSGAALYCGATALSVATKDMDEALRNDRHTEAERLLAVLDREMERLEELARDIL